MAVVMSMKWSGVTPDQYEQVRRSVDWEGDTPEGAIFHVAGFDDDGLRVVDLWESAEQGQAFVGSRLMPATREMGVEGEPEVELYPAHATFTANPAAIGA
jgi:hypothetical protein